MLLQLCFFCPLPDTIYIRLRGAGQSRGFGFVHMDNAESASNAAAAMHGKMMDGRALVVRLRSEGPGGGGGGGRPDRPRGFGPAENDESKVRMAASDVSFLSPCLRSVFLRRLLL